MLSNKEKSELFFQILNYINENNSEGITRAWEGIDIKDKVWVLTSKCSQSPGTLPFMAILRYQCIRALLTDIPDEEYITILSCMEDRNTPLIEAIAWDIKPSIEAFLSNKNAYVIGQLLNQCNYVGVSTRDLLISYNKNKDENSQILSDIL
ncbi:MAG: hypothetical protein JKX76_02730 [Colwellia sp.]|nr:hypothetical protein [Colwellia sp.]